MVARAVANGGALKSVADNVWIFDDRPIKPLGAPVPIRMTILRLADGAVLLHSPTRYSRELRDEIERLGRIAYLMAPNVAHWMFLPDWQAALPDAMVVAAPGLSRRGQVRASGLRIDRELNDGPLEEWRGEIETVLIQAPLFAEVALFHKPSHTLVLTDLVQNLDPETLPPLARGLADLLGSTAPNGRAPAYLRGLIHLGGQAAREAAARLVALRPERVIFAHGRWFEEAGTERLRRALDWLLAPRTPRRGRLRGSPGGQSGGEISRRARQTQRDDLRGLRVVITGASSGIGRATALAFARRGASVALAARREPVLRELAAECEALGGRALAVPTDVADAEAVMRLGESADQAFGGIDVWINNAGTGVFGAWRDADIALHRRAIEVNLFGAMHGASAALKVFLRQRRGVLINMISLGGWAPAPFAAAYTASKFGLRGFSASLRQELAEWPGIKVCGVFPAMVDTPGFVHGANMSGRRLDPGPLLYQAEDVAQALVRLVRDPRDEIAVGWPARAGQIAYALAPGPTERLFGAGLRFLLARASAAPKSQGTLLQPAPQGRSSSGGWLAQKGLPPATQTTQLVAATIGAVALVLAVRRAGRRRI